MCTRKVVTIENILCMIAVVLGISLFTLFVVFLTMTSYHHRSSFHDAYGDFFDLKCRYVSAADYPFVAALTHSEFDDKSQFLCVLTIVHSDWLVTTASCLDANGVEELRKDRMLVRYGSNTWLAGRFAQKVSSIHVHPEFRNNSLQDCGLVRVHGGMSFSATSQVAYLTRGIFTKDIAKKYGSMALTVGWNGDREPRDIQLKSGEVLLRLCGQNDTSKLEICSDESEDCSVGQGAPLLHNGLLMGLCRYADSSPRGQRRTFVYLIGLLDWIQQHAKITTTRRSDGIISPAFLQYLEYLRISRAANSSEL